MATTATANTKATKGKGKEAPVPLPKCASAHTQVAKPQAKMLRKISKITGEATKGLRPKRWDNYKVGMTLQHCKVTPGLDHLDVLFYVENGLMQLADATEKEVENAIAAWQKSKPAS